MTDDIFIYLKNEYAHSTVYVGAIPKENALLFKDSYFVDLIDLHERTQSPLEVILDKKKVRPCVKRHSNGDVSSLRMPLLWIVKMMENADDVLFFTKRPKQRLQRLIELGGNVGNIKWMHALSTWTTPTDMLSLLFLLGYFRLESVYATLLDLLSPSVLSLLFPGNMTLMKISFVVLTEPTTFSFYNFTFPTSQPKYVVFTSKDIYLFGEAIQREILRRFTNNVLPGNISFNQIEWWKYVTPNFLTLSMKNVLYGLAQPIINARMQYAEEDAYTTEQCLPYYSMKEQIEKFIYEDETLLTELQHTFDITRDGDGVFMSNSAATMELFCYFEDHAAQGMGPDSAHDGLFVFHAKDAFWILYYAIEKYGRNVSIGETRVYLFDKEEEPEAFYVYMEEPRLNNYPMPLTNFGGFLASFVLAFVDDDKDYYYILAPPKRNARDMLLNRGYYAVFNSLVKNQLPDDDTTNRTLIERWMHYWKKSFFIWSDEKPPSSPVPVRRWWQKLF
jgi:hypothetical protein